MVPELFSSTSSSVSHASSASLPPFSVLGVEEYHAEIDVAKQRQDEEREVMRSLQNLAQESREQLEGGETYDIIYMYIHVPSGSILNTIYI